MRGLMLGLALGDAIGSAKGAVPEEGPLLAGCATQLSAWTAEGIMRAATRYGGHVAGNPNDVIRHAYQRWALLRGAAPERDVSWLPLYNGDRENRGWLIDAPGMAEVRGSSPTTLDAVINGRAKASTGYHGTVRTLPFAALIGPDEHRQVSPLGIAKAAHYASQVSAITHDHPETEKSVALAMHLVGRALREPVAVHTALTDAVSKDYWFERGGPERAAVLTALREPRDPETLVRMASDRSGRSAVFGGLYVAGSFPDRDQITDALTFARQAPHAAPVAAVAGAILGAVHGFEALPTRLVHRLELGWVMDQLGGDLARQTTENQVGAGWKSEAPDPEPPLDPWWEVRYPGV
ncbi:ADP-ribosylglycohydrolase family protein [Marmoricola sp. OAE513]|uniref:ADP-ribosylglycohydrolase family protein n=1 Tax=Marmoricola sp. OAE513 TaxID=2817894 RepID=UPI0033910936